MEHIVVTGPHGAGKMRRRMLRVVAGCLFVVGFVLLRWSVPLSDLALAVFARPRVYTAWTQAFEEMYAPAYCGAILMMVSAALALASVRR